MDVHDLASVMKQPASKGCMGYQVPCMGSQPLSWSVMGAGVNYTCLSGTSSWQGEIQEKMFPYRAFLSPVELFIEHSSAHYCLLLLCEGTGEQAKGLPARASALSHSTHMANSLLTEACLLPIPARVVYTCF